MRLKRLEMQGYKSFAAPTELVFDSSVTAVVGPNGSGKSNIADAIRWVLGEQSYATLRGKRTDDMIFSGSSERARLGMAQAMITLDNEDHSLPIDYGEVTIERRAYRSGENEYRINGNRVRLRDINDLLSAAGLSKRTYAVIGQGLVDAALSLRPEERRTLFEEAAGITGYQGKRAEAIGRLQETTQNILRVNDIISEIQPRLKRLARQAEQAVEYQRIDQELRELLFEWYGFRWHQAHRTLADAVAATRTQERNVTQRRTDLEGLGQTIAKNRARQQELRQELGEWHRESSAVHAKSEANQRDLAIRQERRRQMEIQREEVKGEIIPLRTNRDGQAERRDEAEAELKRLDREIFEHRTKARELEAQIGAIQERRKTLVAELTESQNRVFHITTRLADHDNRIAQIAEQRERVGHEQQTHSEKLQEHLAEQQRLNGQLGQFRKSLAEVDAAIGELRARQQELQQTVDEHSQEQAGVQARIKEARAAADQLQSRYDGLSRLRDEMADYYEGVRAVLSGKAKPEFPGLLGTVAGLVQVEPALERAVEVALGNHIQDIVAESWDEAQKAIDYLKRNRAGRATFLPLDSLRPARPLDAPRRTGVIGLALELVTFEEKLRPVFELVLGHTIVVEDLKVAHQVFKEMRGGFQIVTPEGEIVRSSGAISGGSAQQRQHGLLSREREWRELPAAIKRATDQLKALDKQERALAGTVAEAQQQMREAEQNSRRLQEQRSGLASRHDKTQQDMAQVMREAEWRKTLLARLEEDLRNLDGRERELGEEQGVLRDEQGRVESAIKQLNIRVAELDNDPAQEEMNAMRTQIALSERAIENQRIILENHWRALRDLERHIEAKENRLAELEAGITALDEELVQLAAQGETLAMEVSELAALIQPADAELSELEKYLDHIGHQENALRKRLHTQEEIYTHANLESQRRRDELDNLRRQIEEDLGFLVETDPVEDVATQQPLPLRPFVERLPTRTQIAANLGDEIRRLRQQKQRLGNVNPNALEEYNEAQDRHVFLTGQAADLQEAATALQAVIAELDELIARDFSKTFRAIAAEFKTYFSILFGGGSARLILTEPDDPLNSGIEIIAKPPGKRQQSLNLLSGGERSLTAASLIFAILKISPTPFCVLDEVDAMLDEANVGRFRDTLRTLSETTQFIVITHNRRTLEIAETIYGISMGKDNTSVIVSLKLDPEADSEPALIEGTESGA